MMKKIVTGLLAAALSVNLFAVSVFADPADGAPPAAEATTAQVSADYQLMASNSQAELYGNEKLGAVAVKDLRSGFIWYSAVPSDTYDRSSLQTMQKDQLDSMLIVTYTELNNNDSSTTTMPINNMEPEIKMEKIDGGLRINYRLDAINMELSVEAKLDGGSLQITVPTDRIIEGEGTVEKMNVYLDKIKKFIESAKAALDEIEDYKIKGAGSDIKKSRSKLSELEKLVGTLDSVVGIAYAQSRAKIILEDELKNYMCGGDGILGRMKNNSNIPSAVSKKWRDMQDEIETCSYNFGLLKSIKYGGLVNLEVAPNMGAAADTEEGYVFYPDGSGALTYNKTTHGDLAEMYEVSVYSDQSVDMAWENNRDSTGLKRAMLPVYGVKKNSHAYLAVIEDGDANASIKFLPSGNTVDLNRINATFLYRAQVQVTSSSQYASGVATIYNKERMKTNPQVRFVFLDGEDADYSGMANAYRTYLLDNQKIKKSSLIGDKLPLAIDMYGYTLKSMLFFQKVMPLSTFEEMNQVIDELNAAGIDNTLLHINSWDRRYEPNQFKVPSELGGKEGLRRLVENTKAAGGQVFLDCNVVDADTFTYNIDSSKLAYNSNLKIYEYQSYWYKLFSPMYVQKQMPGYMQKLEKLGNPGIGQYRMGSMIYNDYNSKYNTGRDECADIWGDLYRMMQQQTLTASYMGNAYLLDGTDWLLDIPMSSTGYIFSDESVPFYQMVVHGLIPYTAKPFNHFYDKQKEKLQTVEYGAAPMYKITYRDSTSLRKLFYGFTTPYESVKDDMVEVYNEMNGRLHTLCDQYIVKHERLNGDVVVETFSGGQKLYINYSNEAYTVGDVTVPALDYVVR
ncbi:MAG: hypothetical protein HFE86_08665 [Clostridiales bacterium]|nr:hypothetical protein [Clostridiales bacterium]